MATVTAEVERTGRLVLAGLWMDAALVMAASAWNGGRALESLGDPFGFGLLLGLAVDVGLAASLVGDRALHLHGRTEPWGRAVRVTTALMSLGLNCAVAIGDRRIGLAVFHAFLPVLLILLSEYAQSSTLQFNAIAGEREAAAQAARDARRAAARVDAAQQRERTEVERRRANGELVTAEARWVEEKEGPPRNGDRLYRSAGDNVSVDRRPSAPGGRKAPTPNIRLGSALTTDSTTSTVTPASHRKPVVPRADRRQWVIDELTVGRNPTGAEVDEKFGPPAVGSKARTGAAIVREAKDKFDAERRSLHVVREGGR